MAQQNAFLCWFSHKILAVFCGPVWWPLHWATKKKGWREINILAEPPKYIFMEVVVPWDNFIIHHRYVLSWVLNSILCQRVHRSASHCRKTVFSTWAPARSGLEFDEKISNSLLLFVHGSVDLCPIPEFRFFLPFFLEWPSQWSCTLYESPPCLYLYLLSVSVAFLFITIPFSTLSVPNASWCSESGRTMNLYTFLMICFPFHFFPNDSQHSI